MNRVRIEKKEKPVIMQHYCSSHIHNGGPATGISLLMQSQLSERFRFVPLIQQTYNTNSLWALFDLVKQIKKTQPDIVHIRGLQSPGFLGLLSAKFAGSIKIVVSVHGSSIDSLGIGQVKLFLYKNIIEPFTLRNADLVYCVCNYAANRPFIKTNSKNLYGFIHNAAPEYSLQNSDFVNDQIRAELDIDKDEILVTYVGRMVYDKGLEDLSNAIKILKEGKPLPIRYIFVGDGNYLSVLKAKLHSENLNNKVIFLGKRSDVKDLLIASDIFVFPTLHENLSNALLEACSAGLAIIATKVGGNPEIIEHNVTGLLVPPNDPIAIAESIKKLALDPKLRKCFSEKAKENVEINFNQNLIFSQLGSVYDSLIK